LRHEIKVNSLPYHTIMQDINFSNITIDKISLPLLLEKDIDLSIFRLDKIDPIISGNKWFKLRYYIEEAKQQKKHTIVTFGGVWSNHIVATAAVCKLNSLNAVGIIRGEEAKSRSSTLTQATQFGMQLYFLNRGDYRRKKIPDELNGKECYFIDEGGYGVKGAAGASTILDHCKKETYSHICCAIGTGAMMGGLINAALSFQKVMGLSVLKNNFKVRENIMHLLNDKEMPFQIIHDYFFGGYAKHSAELIDFMNEFYRQTMIPSDFVYTGKLFYAVFDLIKKDFFPQGSKLLLIHSGGLLGNASLREGTLIF